MKKIFKTAAACLIGLSAAFAAPSAGAMTSPPKDDNMADEDRVIVLTPLQIALVDLELYEEAARGKAKTPEFAMARAEKALMVAQCLKPVDLDERFTTPAAMNALMARIPEDLKLAATDKKLAARMNKVNGNLVDATDGAHVLIAYHIAGKLDTFDAKNKALDVALIRTLENDVAAVEKELLLVKNESTRTANGALLGSFARGGLERALVAIATEGYAEIKKLPGFCNGSNGGGLQARATTLDATVRESLRVSGKTFEQIIPGDDPRQPAMTQEEIYNNDVGVTYARIKMCARPKGP